MATSHRPAPAFSPESPYAAELQQGVQRLRFSPALEAEYVRSHLGTQRTFIRIACMLALAMVVFRIADNAFGEFALPLPLWPAIAAVLLCTSSTLTWLAWSPSFERRYSSVARIIVPLRNGTAAIPVAAMTAAGHVELLMIVPAMVLAPFFFLGLQYRTALVTVVLTVSSFLISGIIFELPTSLLSHAGAFLVITAAACAFAAREMEKWSRKSFLESRIIAELAQHDALTGAKNRRVLDEHLARLWRQAIDDRRSMAIVLADIDHFKAYNDRYGHQAGDQALRRVAQAMQTFACRPLDLLARYGGEEFAAVFYGIDGKQASDIAERMRHAVSALAIEHRGSRTQNIVTVSLGVAVVTPSAGRQLGGVLQLADEALYNAKMRGRNRVELAGEKEYGALVTGVFSAAALKAHLTRM